MINIPPYQQMPIVVTGMMEQAMFEALECHLLGCGACCWYGDTGIGKTATAHHMKQELEENFNVNAKYPDAFRALHFECAPIVPGVNAMKVGIRMLYQFMTGSFLSPGIYHGACLEELTKMVVNVAKKRGIKMIFVDEAGLMSADAIRGLMLICDIAIRMSWQLTMVLIGDNNLPMKISRVPPLERRIEGWVHFTRYEFEATCQILRGLHPHFGSLDPEAADHCEQLEFMHKICEGLPARIVPFLNYMDYYLKISSCRVDLRLLQTIHLLMKHNNWGVDIKK